jgi:hypothetical protein
MCMLTSKLSAFSDWGAMQETGRSRVRFCGVIAIFSNYLIFPAAPVPGAYSASNINEYQKQKNNVSGK